MKGYFGSLFFQGQNRSELAPADIFVRLLNFN
jgi:hypothetical protein